MGTRYFSQMIADLSFAQPEFKITHMSLKSSCEYGVSAVCEIFCVIYCAASPSVDHSDFVNAAKRAMTRITLQRFVKIWSVASEILCVTDFRMNKPWLSRNTLLITSVEQKWTDLFDKRTLIFFFFFFVEHHFKANPLN